MLLKKKNPKEDVFYFFMSTIGAKLLKKLSFFLIFFIEKKKLSALEAGNFCLYIDAMFFEVFIKSLFLLHKRSNYNLEGATDIDIDVCGV